MKTTQILRKMWLGLVALLPLLATVNTTAQVNNKPFVVPEVTEWQGAEGQLQLSGRVLASRSLEQVARQFVADAKAMGLQPFILVKGKPKQGDIVLQLSKMDTRGKEAYAMEIGRTVNVKAVTPTGAFWATRTLLQLVQQGALPKGQLVDEPQYAMRGFMLDCGRKYIPMDYLRSLVKVLSFYKMNTLQIHLNDNGFVQFFNNDWERTQSAFRLESDTYPDLSANEAQYTKKEFVELQQLAEQLGVEIIPEIDVPAHSLAFTQFKPELASKTLGMDHLDLSNPAVVPFVDKLFEEYIGGKNPVFRGPRVHIGTDEYSNATEELREQFRAFTDHLLALVQRHGKQPVLWGALSHAPGKTTVRNEGVLMSVWNNGFSQPKEMKKQGYKMISIPDHQVYIVPAAGYYHDYLNNEELYRQWTPAHIGSEVFEERDPSIEGGMFAVWNDHVGNGITVKDIHHRFFAALPVMATKCWTASKTTLPYEQFAAKTAQLTEAPGVNELGRTHGKTLQLSQLQPNQPTTLPQAEVGFGHEVSVQVECAPESKGTVLLSNDRATFYLSDPQEGKVGFGREGYINSFNYQLPTSGTVHLRIVCQPTYTELYVNGRLQERLASLPLVAPVAPALFIDHECERPTLVKAEQRYTMYYQRTLFFPLQKAGNFQSKVTQLVVKEVKEK